MILTGHCSHVIGVCVGLCIGLCSFTLPDNDTYTETDTDKMFTEIMDICISLGLGPLKPLPSIIIKPNSTGTGINLGLGLGLGQCKHSMNKNASQ